MANQILLGVNVDHVATLRQARLATYPDPLEAMVVAEGAGADGITVHLREDKRHIQDEDVRRIQTATTTRVNLELAVTDEMFQFAKDVNPAHCCFVPERREELTTEGGLNVISHEAKIKQYTEELAQQGMEVSLFIDPDIPQIESAIRTGAPAIELHTGAYADADNDDDRAQEFARIVRAASFANEAGLIVNAGHGLNFDNVAAVAAIPEINELNIGHSLVAYAIFMGLGDAIKKMKRLMIEARQ